MKFFAFIFLLSYSIQSQAVSRFNTYKIVIQTGTYYDQVAVFSLDSAANLIMIENDNFFDIQVLPFFNDITINFRTGGDEDFIKGRFVLTQTKKNQKLITYCSAQIDVPNKYLTNLRYEFAKLMKLNPRTQKFETFDNLSSNESTNRCVDEINSEYKTFETI